MSALAAKFLGLDSPMHGLCLLMTVVAAGVGLVAGALICKARRSARTKAPLAPGAHWLLGHLPLLSRADYLRHALQLAELGPVVRLRILHKDSYLVSDAQLISSIITKGPTYAHKSSAFYARAKNMSAGHLGLFNQWNEESPEWKVVRKTLAPCFSTDNLKKYFPHARQCAEELARSWSQKVAAGGGETCVTADEGISRCTLDVIGASGFQVQFRALEGSKSATDFLQAVHEVLLETTRRINNPLREPLQKLLPFLPENRRIAGCHARVNGRYQAILDDLRSRGPSREEDQSVGAGIMRLVNPETGKPWPDTFLCAQIATFILGGFDTSAWTLTWFLYDLACFPAWQQAIKEELRSAGLLHTPVCSGRLLEWYGVSPGPPILNAVLKESMRIHPVAGQGTVREAPADMEIGGYYIPKGAMIWMPFMAAHLSYANFTAPHSFDPTRWLDTAGMQAARAAGAVPKEPPQAVDLAPPLMPRVGVTYQGPHATPTGHAKVPGKSWLAFSDGPRNCIGMQFAYMDVRTIAVTLLSRFWFEVHPDMGSLADVEKNQVAALVLTAGGGMKLTIKEHSA